MYLFIGSIMFNSHFWWETCMAPQRPALWHPLETLLAQVRHENLASLAVGARGGCILRPVVDFLKIKYVERIVWRIEQQIDCYRLFQHHVEKILVEWPYIYIYRCLDVFWASLGSQWDFFTFLGICWGRGAWHIQCRSEDKKTAPWGSCRKILVNVGLWVSQVWKRAMFTWNEATTMLGFVYHEDNSW